MNPTKAAAIILILIGSAFAKLASKPVSRYMRDMGILYLETVEKLTPECGQNSDCTSRWESTMESIEDRVNIALNDKSQRRSPGDMPYWDLLKNVKYARGFSIYSGKAWLHAYITCYAYAHTVALEGDYFNGDGGCGNAIDAATHQ